MAAGAPPMRDFLCTSCRDHQAGLETHLAAMELPFEYDPFLVRGLDYYTRTVFEVVSDAGGAPLALVGGGRYDRLVETLGGPPTPALGFGMGLERLLLALEAQGLLPPETDRCPLFIATRAVKP